MGEQEHRHSSQADLVESEGVADIALDVVFSSVRR
jgi:hypothetical protein